MPFFQFMFLRAFCLYRCSPAPQVLSDERRTAAPPLLVRQASLPEDLLLEGAPVIRYFFPLVFYTTPILTLATQRLPVPADSG